MPCRVWRHMLTQAEADQFFNETKVFSEPVRIIVGHGSNGMYRLLGKQSGEEFVLDVWRNSIKVTKTTLQNRVKSVFTLARLDVDAAPHTNPDGVKIPGPHVHVYREGYSDRWAIPIEDCGSLLDTSSISQLVYNFCSYCNIDSSNLNVQEGLL